MLVESRDRQGVDDLTPKMGATNSGRQVDLLPGNKRRKDRIRRLPEPADEHLSMHR